MDMQGLIERIEKRLHSVGMTATEASMAATGSKDTIRNWKRSAEKGGEVGAAHRKLEAVADVLGTNVTWLTDGVGPELGPALSDRGTIVPVPVVSMVSAGRLKQREGVTSAEVERWINVDDLPKGDWVALTVDGDSMNRVAPDQAMILVNRADSALIDGRFYIFGLPNGETTFKTFKRDPLRLQPYSTNPDHMSIPIDDDGDVYVFGRVRRVIQDI
jgi:SOS-response transcriptional repressor LexA